MSKGQASIFTVIFIIIIFVIILGVGLAPFINVGADIALESSGITGLEAFMLANLLLWIIIIFIIWALWSTR